MDILTEPTGFPSTTDNTKLTQFFSRINDKVNQLKSVGLTREDQSILKNGRLNLIWGEDEIDDKRGQTTKWRRNRARRTYLEIQDASNHLFLVVALVFPPTECAKTEFDELLESLLRFQSYKHYNLGLDPTYKNSFESIAALQGFSRNRHYLNFLKDVFPQSLYS